MERKRRLFAALSVAAAIVAPQGTPRAEDSAGDPELRHATFTRQVVNLEFAAETMQSNPPFPLTRGAALAAPVWYGTIRRRLPGDANGEKRRRVAFAASYRDGKPVGAVYDANLNGDLGDDPPATLYAYPAVPGARSFLAELRWAAGDGDVEWTLRVVLDAMAPSDAVARFRLQSVHAMAGTVALGGREHRALLLDGNRDGRYTKSQGDGILIDFDDDLRLNTDAMSPEYGPLRVPFQVGARRCEVVEVDPHGRSLAYRDLGEEAPRPQAVVGESAPDFTVEGSNGKRLSLSSLRGKVVLLDFWTSTCARCDLQAPALRDLYATYRDRGLEILGISYDLDPATAAEFRDRHGATWPTDVSGRSFEENEIGRLYKVNGAGTIFLVDKDGTLEGSYVEMDPLRSRLEAMLGTAAPPERSTGN